MAVVRVKCPSCKVDQVSKYGKTADGKQRYICLSAACKKNTFILHYQQRGKDPDVKKQIIDMALNGSGIRDTSRVLGVSQTTVINEIKKRKNKL